MKEYPRMKGMFKKHISSMQKMDKIMAYSSKKIRFV